MIDIKTTRTFMIFLVLSTDQAKKQGKDILLSVLVIYLTTMHLFEFWNQCLGARDRFDIAMLALPSKLGKYTTSYSYQL